MGFALAIYLALGLIGAPIWLLVRPAAPPVSDALACPLLGLAVLQVFSWYWLRYAGGGMQRGLPILGAAVVVALVGIGWSGRTKLHAPSVVQCVSTVALLVATALVFVVEFRVPLRSTHLTAASIYNTDVGAYVTVAGNLVSHGFGWAGNIAGISLGGYATDLPGGGPGIFSTLAAAAVGTGTETWQMALPVLLLAVALGALAVRDAARILLPGSVVAAPGIALLATTASLFGYLTTNYFLAQIFVMPLAIGELLALHWIARQSSWRDRTAGLTLLAAIVVTATLSYSPMPFLMQPVIVGAVCLGEIGRGWFRRSLVVAGAVIGAVLFAAALTPEHFKRAVDLSHGSFSVSPGWPLRLMTPLDVLGLRQAIGTPRSMVWEFLFEAVVLGAIVSASVWALWGTARRAAIFQAAVAFVVLASYAVVYADRGYSYEQWKWISFFQPVFVAAVCALVVAAAGVVLARWLPTLRLVGRAVAVVAGVVLLAATARMLVIETRYTRAYWIAGSPPAAWSSVGPPLTALADREELTRLDAVNVDVGQWDSMWVAYFLEPTTRVYLKNLSVFAVSKPKARWTLEARYDPLDPYNSLRTRYVLVPHTR